MSLRDQLPDMAAAGTAAKIIAALLLVPLTYYILGTLQYIKKYQNIGKVVDKFPGKPKHWLWGNLHQHLGLGPAQLQQDVKMAATYKTAWRFWYAFIKPTVVCCHPDTIKILLQSSAPKETVGINSYILLMPWLGNGLLLSKGPQWHRNRKLLTPAFHFDVLKPYMQVYNEAADILLAKWLPSAHTGSTIEIFQPVSLCTLNVIMRCAFSYNTDVQTQGLSHPYTNTVMSLATLTVKRGFNPIAWFDTIYYATADGRQYRAMCEYAHNVAYDLIHKRQKALKENPDEQKKRYLDFLDILLLAKDETGQGLTEHEIRQEVDTFLFEGHDTTASAISWCLHALAKHPDIQQSVYREVTELTNGRVSPHLVWDDLSKMPYLTLCIKESLRLTPPVPFISIVLEHPLKIEDILLPKGTFMDANIWSVHHNEHEYKPERLSPENMKNKDSFAFIPFSACARNCIGQNFAMHELKVIIARILLKYQLRLAPGHEAEMKTELVMRAKDGIHLLLSIRN